MSGLQLMAVIENIPLNIKNSMRRAKKFFYNFGDGNYGHANTSNMLLTGAA